MAVFRTSFQTVDGIQYYSSIEEHFLETLQQTRQTLFESWHEKVIPGHAALIKASS